MKSFKDYLTESKKVYEFRIKIAGDCPKDCATRIKGALSQYSVETCSAGKSTPIQETQRDFPELANVGLTHFNVTLKYPTTSAQVKSAIAEKCGITAGTIKVRTPLEELETELNYSNAEKSGESLLGKDYEASNNQKSFGEKQITSFLKELSKTKTQGTQYKGVNNDILAKSAPSEKSEGPAKTKAKAGGSPLSKVTNPDPRKGK